VESEALKTDEHEAITPARRCELLDDLKGCVNRAQEGDDEVLSKVREIFKETPRLARILVDLANTAERSFLRSIAADDSLTQEALPPQLKAMRKDLACPDPSPLERLLAERTSLLASASVRGRHLCPEPGRHQLDAERVPSASSRPASQTVPVLKQDACSDPQAGSGGTGQPC
jgi:hypothetical protein